MAGKSGSQFLRHDAVWLVLAELRCPLPCKCLIFANTAGIILNCGKVYTVPRMDHSTNIESM